MGNGDWLGNLNDRLKAQQRANLQPKKQPQKRQKSGQPRQGPPKDWAGPNAPKDRKIREVQPLREAGGKMGVSQRAPDPEGFSRLFGRRTLGSQEQRAGTGSLMIRD
eukprot:7939723-Heterocapsa_arctica.AAC.1